MPAKVSPTLQVLLEIRDELKGTNTRLDSTNARLDAVEDAVTRLGKGQTEMEVRLTTELVAVSTAVQGVRDLLRSI